MKRTKSNLKNLNLKNLFLNRYIQNINKDKKVFILMKNTCIQDFNKIHKMKKRKI